MIVRPPHRRSESPAACGIAGHALVAAPLSEIATLRDRPGPAGAPALPPRFLRHCDEHTVVGMHAVLAALAARGVPADVSGHSVVAASCQVGRLTAARTLANLATGGGVSVTPHIVPQCSLHSVAGAVSVGLGMHGPQLGVGGGVDALAEGLFAAVTIAHAASAGDPPCVWLVATEWDEEPALDAAGAAAGDPLVRALALAIEPAAPDAAGTGRSRTGASRGPAATSRRVSDTSSLALTMHLPGASRPCLQAVHPAGRLAEFARALDMCRDGTALVSWVIECPWGAEIRVSRRREPAAGAVKAVPLRGAA